MKTFSKHLANIKRDLELSIESAERRTYSLKFFVWLRLAVLSFVYHISKDQCGFDATRPLLNPIEFYKRKRNNTEFLVSKLIFKAKLDDNVIEPKNPNSYGKLVEWATSSERNEHMWRKAGTLPNTFAHSVGFYDTVKGRMLSDAAIRREIDRFQSQKFHKEAPKAYADLKRYWSLRVSQFPQERRFYKKVSKSISYNEDKIKELFEKNSEVTGKDLMEII